MPVRVDPKQRQTCLTAWPKPQPIEHHRSDAQRSAVIYNLSIEAPLVSVKYVVEVEVQETRTVKRGVPGFRKSKMETTSLGKVCAEIFFHPRLQRTAGEEERAAPGVQPNNTLSIVGRQPPTPHASLAPVRVFGEVLSRGPAAVLMDRGTVSAPQPFITPQRFAQLHQVVAQGVDVVPGTPMYTPAIAFVIDVPAEQGQQSQGQQTPATPVACTATPLRDDVRVVSPLLPLPLAMAIASSAPVRPSTAESVSPSSSSSSGDRPATPVSLSDELQVFLDSLPQTEGVGLLARLQGQTVYHVLPSRALNASDATSLLLSCSSTTDRETMLFLLVEEKCLKLGHDALLLEPGGAIEQCFPLGIQRGEFFILLLLLLPPPHPRTSFFRRHSHPCPTAIHQLFLSLSLSPHTTERIKTRLRLSIYEDSPEV